MPSRSTCQTRVSTLLLATASIIALACVGSGPVYAACDTWTLGGSGNWYGSGGWDGGDPNSSLTDVCITDGASTVTLNGSASVADLTLSTGNELDIPGQLNIFGSSLDNAGLIKVQDGTLQVSGSSLTLSGGGAIEMSSNAFVDQNSAGHILINFDNLIEGTGQLGQNGLALNNQSAGTVNANVNGGTLSLNGSGLITNAGLLEATNGGILSIQNTVNNTGNITADGGTVSLFSTINGGFLNTLNSGVMNSNGTLNGVTLSAGSTLTDTGTTILEGTIVNNGTILVPDTDLQIGSSTVTLTGGGTVQMSSNGFFRQNSAGETLDNINNLVEGTGQLGQNGMLLDNESAGVVNANVNGGTLSLNGGGLVTNAGLLEATSGGILSIQNTVNNTGNITADGGTVSLFSTINGGFLNTLNSGVMNSNGTLNSVTLSAGSTLTDTGTTILEGTIVNNGTILVPNTDLQIGSSTVTLTGGGTVQMSSNGFFRQNSGGETLDNINNLIEGTGQLGQNGMALENESAGVVNANVNGGTLSLNGGGLVTNAGLLEATSGGILSIQNNVENASGNITADGGTVNLTSGATISDGTLNTLNSGAMNSNVATLNNVTLSTGSTLTDTGTTILEGTIVNNGTILVPDTDLQLGSSTVTLTGGGTVQMSSNGFFRQNSGGETLDNINNLIEGTGQLGQNGMALENESAGVVNANVNGGTLSLNGGGLITNTGLLEATNGGILSIQNNVENASGNITADGGTVNLTSGATISDGTLNTLNSGAMNSNVATLNNVTLSGGSTLADTGTTFLKGTLNNLGTVLVPNTDLQIVGNVTLTGGGTVQMSSDGFFRESSGGETLFNVDNLIEGTGQLGQNGLSLDNEADGTILANVSGGTLNINGGGTVTNAGLFEVAAGSTLHVNSGAFTNWNGGTQTLTGGTYEIFGNSGSPGTMQINELGSGGGEIVNNNASIILDGINSNFVDTTDSDALSNLTNNQGSGSFTILNGRNFITPGAFANAGQVTIGTGSTFTAGNTLAAYNQSGGTTLVDGTLKATQVNVHGGYVEGTGTLGTPAVESDLFNYGGTVRPGDPGNVGKLSIDGNFTQSGGGTLEIDIAGTATGQYSQLDVNGHSTLDGTLAVQLLHGFSFAAGQMFDIVNTDPFSGDFSAFTLDGVSCTSGGADTWHCSNLASGLFLTELFLDGGDQLWLEVNGNTNDVPEPPSLILLASALALFGAEMMRRRSKA